MVDVTYDDKADLLTDDAAMEAMMTTPLLPVDVIPSTTGDGKLTVTFYTDSVVRDLTSVLAYFALIPSEIVCEPG